MKKSLFALAVVFLLLGLTSCEQPGPGDPDTPDIPENTIDFELLVLDSLNGSPLNDVTVSLMRTGETETAYTGTSDSNGVVVIEVDEDDENASFDILSSKTDRASCRIQDFTFGTGKLPVLYNHQLMMTSFEAEAPSISAVEFSANGTDWSDAVDSLASEDLNYIRVTAQARSEIKATEWCGYGLKISLNSIITHWDGLEPTSFEKEGEEIGTTGYYETIAIFDLSTHDYMAGDYSLFVNAYDVAANRAEQTLSLNLTTDTVVADPSLSGVQPVITYFTAKTYSVSRDYFGAPIDPVKSIVPQSSPLIDGNGTTVYIGLDLSIVEEIRRIDVFRSDDGGITYKELDRNLTFTKPTSAGAYSYSDFDPTLEIGKEYFYKVIAFNNSGASDESDPVQLTLLPPHNTLLSSPANKSVSDSLEPEFTFAVTNKELLDTTTAQYLHFQLQLRDTTAPMYYIPFIWDRVNGLVEIYGTALPVDYTDYFVAADADAGTITVFYTNLVYFFGLDPLEAGKSYEWNIIDDGHGSYFSNEYSNGEVQSLASNSANGQGALNGWFTLTISDTAQ
jgi:uncharacterized protein YkuJ